MGIALIAAIDKPPFIVSETGWGEFPLNIRIQFAPETGEKALQFTHGLKLHHWGPAVQGPVQPEGREKSASVAGGEGEKVEVVGEVTGTPIGTAPPPKPASTSGGRAGTGPSSVATPVDVDMDADGAASVADTGKPSDADAEGEKDADAEGEADIDGEGEVDADAEGEEDIEVDGIGSGTASRDGEGVNGNGNGGDAMEVDTPGGQGSVQADPALQANTQADENPSEDPSLNANILPVHSWQYDQIIFSDPTQTLYELLLAHPETPLPAKSLRRGAAEGEGAILEKDRGSAGVPMEFTRGLERGEEMKLEKARRELVMETDRWR